ncbi:MAG: RIP metalloprotease RseP [Polyangiaceae bacterium]|nr:RIP metalloprotease RseP [Polyangiaceae bacterium]
MDLVYFILLTSSLIFVHELGHYLVAKAFGVKVLTFSLGFGPRLLRFRGRETEYSVGLLPLGGYVRMLESSKNDIVMPEDRHRTFEQLAVHKRVLVVLAGPAMNLVFPVLLYFSVFVGDGPFLPPTVGIALPGHAAYGKLREGDRVMSVNGAEIGTFDELRRIVSRNPGHTLRLKVFRDGKHVEVEVTPEETIVRRELDIVERVGTLHVEASAPAAVIGVMRTESPAYRAGLRTFDVVTHVAGAPVRRFVDLQAALADNHGETVPVTYLRPIMVPDAVGRLAQLAVYEAGVVALTPAPTGADVLERTGLELADLYAAVVPEESSLHQAGVRPGDRLLRLDQDTLPAWSTFKERLRAEPEREHHVEYFSAREGRERSGTFRVRREDFVDERGQAFARYVLRVQQWIPLAPESRVDHPHPIRYALEKAVEETADVTRFVLVAIVRLAQGRLSLDSLSGPITIYEVAGEEGRKGADYFVWVMALLSINLGLLNLLPIPVLDGGHLMFFVIEGILRRPLPLRVREIAHIVGMAVLVALMALAFKNDVEKRWDAIAGRVRSLSG